MENAEALAELTVHHRRAVLRVCESRMRPVGRRRSAAQTPQINIQPHGSLRALRWHDMREGRAARVPLGIGSRISTSFGHCTVATEGASRG